MGVIYVLSVSLMDHLNAKNLMSYLNLPNSILCVNTHSPCGKTRIIPSTQFPHQLDMTGNLNVTNFMRHLNVTNSLIYLNTHNLRGKIHITSSTSAEVPISSPTWLNGSSCVTNFMRRLNVTNSIFYLPTHRLTREDAYKVINGWQSASILTNVTWGVI